MHAYCNTGYGILFTYEYREVSRYYKELYTQNIFLLAYSVGL